MLTDIDRLKIAEELLKIKAVVINPKKPFRWASGILSPIYCDNRKTLSYPKIRTFIRNSFVDKINSEFGKPDIIAGVATGGIAQGALVAQEMGLPFIYVRPEPKSHGTESQIEGEIHEGQSVVVVEDLISTGGSSIKCIKALKKAGAMVKGLVAVFSYGFKESEEAFKKENVKTVILTDYSTLLEVALKKEYIHENELRILESWAKDPKNWKGKE
jgi:orotate phosphoribosyltransferase